MQTASGLKPGTRVITNKELDPDLRGIMVHPKHLRVRKTNQPGMIEHYAPGHGGDVWYVKHDDSDEIGAYIYTEFELLQEKEVANG